MAVSVDLIRELREKTGAGIVNCRQALEASKGNLDMAVEWLNKKGLDAAEKKSSRTASDGQIGTYIHSNGKMGVLIEVNCETDFVARTDAFRELIKDLALHVCAMNPRYVTSEEIPQEARDKELTYFRADAKAQGKPENVVEKIAQGRFEKWCAEVCLLDQPYVKDPSIAIKDHVKAHIAKLGENIVVRRFVRFELGK